jgi:CBS-domain-containing membrane protein
MVMVRAFIGIYLISILSQYTYNLQNSLLLVASFGASAVLIYGAPQAEFSQPRNLLGGHVVSAFIGVSIYKYMPFDVALLGALAVSLSILVMHFTRTLHPPGGATALIAVTGGAEIHNARYLFVVFPILGGTLILLIVALFINNLSGNLKRHYPKYWL